jgi:hypothetical protein
VRAGVAVPAAGGLVAECGAWGVMLLLILVAGWPRWRFRSGGPRTTPVVMPDPTPSDPELVLDPGTLDDEGLCRAWRTSFWRLQEARGAEALGLVVRQRQRFLDELASRHPAEVDRWLRSGPRAASNPWPFLQPTPPTH